MSATTQPSSKPNPQTSSSEVSGVRNRNRQKSTSPSPTTSQDASRSSSKKPKRLRVNDPKDTVRVLRRLKVSQRSVEQCPKISEMLIRVLKTREAVIDTMRFSEHPCAIDFLKTWDRISKSDRDLVPFEAVCLKSQVRPHELLGAILMASKDIKARESALVAITSHPDTVRATAFYAGLADNHADRKMMHDMVGALPTAKGTNIVVNLAGGNPQLSAPEQDDEESFMEAFPSVNQELEGWSENRRRMLGDGK